LNIIAKMDFIGYMVVLIGAIIIIVFSIEGLFSNKFAVFLVLIYSGIALIPLAFALLYSTISSRKSNYFALVFFILSIAPIISLILLIWGY